MATTWTTEVSNEALLHKCPAEGCTVQLSREGFLCREHWEMVTPYARRHLLQAYRAYCACPGKAPKQLDLYMEARGYARRLANQASKQREMEGKCDSL